MANIKIELDNTKFTIKNLDDAMVRINGLWHSAKFTKADKGERYIYEQISEKLRISLIRNHHFGNIDEIINSILDDVPEKIKWKEEKINEKSKG